MPLGLPELVSLGHRLDRTQPHRVRDFEPGQVGGGGHGTDGIRCTRRMPVSRLGPLRHGPSVKSCHNESSSCCHPVSPASPEYAPEVVR